MLRYRADQRQLGGRVRHAADEPGAQPSALEPSPVLMLSETPRISGKLARLAWPFLDASFRVDAMLAEAKLRMFERGARTRRPEPATTTTALDLETLRAEVVEANRRFDAIVRQLGYLKT